MLLKSHRAALQRASTRNAASTLQKDAEECHDRNCHNQVCDGCSCSMPLESSDRQRQTERVCPSCKAYLLKPTSPETFVSSVGSSGHSLSRPARAVWRARGAGLAKDSRRRASVDVSLTSTQHHRYRPRAAGDSDGDGDGDGEEEKEEKEADDWEGGAEGWVLGLHTPQPSPRGRSRAWNIPGNRSISRNDSTASLASSYRSPSRSFRCYSEDEHTPNYSPTPQLSSSQSSTSVPSKLKFGHHSASSSNLSLSLSKCKLGPCSRHDGSNSSTPTSCRNGVSPSVFNFEWT
eukprot:g48119.t1